MKLNGKSINYNVQTVDELVSLDGLEGDTVVVTDEDRGGVFVYREDNVGTNNGGTIFNGWTRQYDGAVNIKWFGAVGDGVTDDTVAIQSTIDYAAPYEWKGTVPDTTNGSAVKAVVFIPAGTFLVSDTIKLSPYLRIEGVQKPTLYSKGSIVKSNINNIAKFVFDTAPYGTGGTRQLGIITGGTAFDSGTVSGVFGASLQYLSIEIPSDDVCKGAINYCVAIGGTVSDCYIYGGNIGIQISCSWCGSFKNNTISVKAIGIYADFDTTQWDITGNWISWNGSTPDVGFTYRDYPDAALTNKTCGIRYVYAGLNMIGNTIERFQHGVRANSNSLSSTHINNYMEGIAEICYVFHTMNINVIVGYTYCDDVNTSLLYAVSCVGQFDVTGTNTLRVNSLLSLSVSTALHIIGNVVDKYKAYLASAVFEWLPSSYSGYGEATIQTFIPVTGSAYSNLVQIVGYDASSGGTFVILYHLATSEAGATPSLIAINPSPPSYTFTPSIVSGYLAITGSSAVGSFVIKILGSLR